MDFIKMLDAVYQLAEFNGTYYRALLEQGFDEDQALEGGQVNEKDRVNHSKRLCSIMGHSRCYA